MNEFLSNLTYVHVLLVAGLLMLLILGTYDPRVWVLAGSYSVLVGVWQYLADDSLAVWWLFIEAAILFGFAVKLRSQPLYYSTILYALSLGLFLQWAELTDLASVGFAGAYVLLVRNAMSNDNNDLRSSCVLTGALACVYVTFLHNYWGFLWLIGLPLSFLFQLYLCFWDKRGWGPD